MIQIWQVPSECGPSNLVVLALGALISLVCALSAGFINVSAAKTKGISRVSLMIAGGIGTYLITFIGYFTMANSDGDNSVKVPLNERALLTVAVATASIIAGHLLVIANQVITLFFKNILT